MQIPPSTAVLRAFSSQVQAPQGQNSHPVQGRITSQDAGREAARAVFSQLRGAAAPVQTQTAAGTGFLNTLNATQAVQTTSPAAVAEAVSGQRALPRGSIVNILV
jgi:hypothetical protein